ncbi:hypothetical protein KY285_032816 [Solanum tuberosum]|nr:hypothetical protein KY289_032923 [Solanum tuberosum]KAH0647568.1 hypothetical protein KY285_032816 [Solanum tuberosum]
MTGQRLNLTRARTVLTHLKSTTLLTLPSKQDGGLFVAEFLSDGLQVPPSRIVAHSLHMRYASVLWNYGVSKVQSGYVSNNEDP